MAKEIQKYSHGGDIYSFAKEQHIKPKQVIDLSSNINFLTPKIKNKFDTKPYPKYDKLIKNITKLYKIKQNQIELFSGGSSAIFSLFKTLNLKTCTLYAPIYLEYKKASKIFDYKLKLINRFENLYQKVPNNSLIIFVNPSTPDGKYYNLDRLFKIWQKANATILIDESFLNFSDNNSAINILKNYKKLYILKSLTKIYGSAGVRVGILISNKNNILQLSKKEPLWKISTYDLNYITKAIKDKNFIKQTNKINKKNKLYLYKILKKSNLFSQIYSSKANFILCKLKNITALQFQDRLSPSNILIRDCSNFDFLNNKFIRIAVKSKQDLKVLKQVIDG